MFELGLQSGMVCGGVGENDEMSGRACDSMTGEAEWEMVDRELHEVMRAHSVLDTREARCLRRAEQLQIWNRFGYPSMLQYLEDRLRYAPRTAYDRLRVARALGELPEIEAALESGVLSHSTARELTRVATPATQVAWLDRARGKNLRDVEELIRGHKKGDHPDDPTDPDVRTRKITFEVSAATYALLRQTRSALADETGRRLADDELVATLCRRSLEIVGAFESADDSRNASESGGESEMVGESDAELRREPTLARYQIAVTTCSTCKRGWQEAAGASIEIDKTAIAIAECDAQHIGSIDDAVPARAHQDVTPATRRLVWRRDRGRCRAKGCRSARNLDVHHVKHRAEGGGHDAANLVLLCSGCHAALHDGLLVVTGDAPDFEFVRLHEQRDWDLDVSNGGTSRSALRADVEPTSAVGARVEPASEHRADERVAVGPSSKFSAAVLRAQARDVLMASGYRSHEAKEAVDAAIAHVGTVPLEQLLPEAFRRCSIRKR